MSFERLLNPRTIAVFGGAQAREAILQSDRMGYKGEIWPVHPKKTEILGRKVFRSVEDLPGSPDAAYVGVNRYLTIDIVRDLAEVNAGGAVCYATGFIEAGEEGSALQEQLLEASGSMPLIGPNCYGLLNYLNGAMLWPDQQGGQRVEEGVAIITMSSNVGFNLTMQRRGLPIAYMVSLGNKLKFDIHDAIQIFAQQEQVTAIGLFMETMSDLRAFEEAVNFARELKKPIVAIKTGHSEVGKKIVVSHTASMAGSDVLMSALFERLGVARVNSLEAFIEALKVLHVIGPLNGGRIGAMSTSGGDLTLLADALGSKLTMPLISEKTAKRIRKVVHERVVAANPLDYQMFDWNDEDQQADKFTAFLSEGFDFSLCLLDYPRDDYCDQSTWSGAERGFVRALQNTDSKGAILTTFADTISETVAHRLMKDGVVMLAGIDDGVAGVRAAVDIGMAWSKPIAPPLLEVPALLPDKPVSVMNEAESKKLLTKINIQIPEAKVVMDPESAVEAANEIGYPVVAKVLGIPHKTDVGGVRVNLKNSREVLEAVKSMEKISDTYLVERMISDCVAELLVGVAQDEQFGPYLVIGGGGILVEIMKDSVSLLLPTTRERVFSALEKLKCAPLLKGFRGAPPADLDAAVDAIISLSVLIENDPLSINELDINPLMLLAEGKGVVAADALISLKKK
jgi:acetyl-CoA synthetase